MPDMQVVEYHRYSNWENPAGWLVDPGSITDKNHTSAGQLRHVRPYIVSGQRIFVFPGGVEGFTRSGQALLGLHRPIGGRHTMGTVINREEGRISLTGTFPGTMSVHVMHDCIEILTMPTPDPGLTLYAPGVFELAEFLLPETWSFEHDPEDRTHSVAYSISFVEIGQGKIVRDKPGTPPPKNPGAKKNHYGKPMKTFTVADGARTLRAISAFVYGTPEKWHKLVDLNGSVLAVFIRSNAMNKAGGLPTYRLATHRWPVGTKFRYE